MQKNYCWENILMAAILLEINLKELKWGSFCSVSGVECGWIPNLAWLLCQKKLLPGKYSYGCHFAQINLETWNYVCLVQFQLISLFAVHKRFRNIPFILFQCGKKRQRGWTLHCSCPSTASSLPVSSLSVSLSLCFQSVWENREPEQNEKEEDAETIGFYWDIQLIIRAGADVIRTQT